MVTFKFEDGWYTAYKANEVGNPHPKRYPCLMSLSTEQIAENQAAILKGYLAEKGLDYHDVLTYADKDINTHDLVTAVVKFHTQKKL